VKQARQYDGRPGLGSKGNVVAAPQAAQVVENAGRGPLRPAGTARPRPRSWARGWAESWAALSEARMPALRSARLVDRQERQRVGPGSARSR